MNELAALEGEDLAIAAQYAARLVTALGIDAAHRAVDMVLDRMSTIDAAALSYDWTFWGRPKQIAPLTGWVTRGYLTGRGFGKTRANSALVNEKVATGKAPLVAIGAQDEDNAIAIQVTGPSGLIATAPPWCRPEWHAKAKELVWPNGARGYVRTPHVPGDIRGLEYHLTWITELQSWPAATRQDAFDNYVLSTRLGDAQIVWDATPKRRHPLLQDLLADHEREPDVHVVIRGHTKENTANLAKGYVDRLERKFGGTQRGREELGGEMLKDSDSATAKQEWIDEARRPMPDMLTRRAIGVDPAVTSKKGSDRTGMVKGGLSADGKACITGDMSGKYGPKAWADKLLVHYVKDRIDLIIAETNKGGELVVQNIRAVAETMGLRVVVVGKTERPNHQDGVVHVREQYSKGAKEDRAQPVQIAYEQRRVCHIEDVDLSTLEDTLTTWEPIPGADSPDDLDALGFVVVDLLDLNEKDADGRDGFKGLEQAAKALAAAGGGTNLANATPAGVRSVIAEIERALGSSGGRGGGRI